MVAIAHQLISHLVNKVTLDQLSLGDSVLPLVMVT